MKLLSKLAALLTVFPLLANATPITIDFEDVDEGPFLPTVMSQGFTFTGSENPGGFPLMAVAKSSEDISFRFSSSR